MNRDELIELAEILNDIKAKHANFASLDRSNLRYWMICLEGTVLRADATQAVADGFVTKELPDNLRVPLGELQADAGYLFGRVAADGSAAAAMAESVRNKLSQIYTAALQLVNAPAPQQDMERAAMDRVLAARAGLVKFEEQILSIPGLDEVLEEVILALGDAAPFLRAEQDMERATDWRTDAIREYQKRTTGLRSEQDMERAVEAFKRAADKVVESFAGLATVQGHIERTATKAGLLAAAPFLRVPEGVAPVHELLERIEHDAKMLKSVCAQRDEAQNEAAGYLTKLTDVLLAIGGYPPGLPKPVQPKERGK